MDVKNLSDKNLCVLYFWSTNYDFSCSKFDDVRETELFDVFEKAQHDLGKEIQMEYWKRFVPCLGENSENGYHCFKTHKIDLQCKHCGTPMFDIIFDNVESEVYCKL